MGVADLRAAFNAAASPRYSCTSALMHYEQHAGIDWQRLTFSGIGPDGVKFEVRSDQLRPGADVITAAREIGAKLLAQGESKLP